jgi:hypothetical protein
MNEPVIRVVSGSPSAEELAALTVAILQLASRTPAAPQPPARRPGWVPAKGRRWARAEPYVVDSR